MRIKTEATKCDSYADFLSGKCYSCKRDGCLRTGYFLESRKPKNDFQNGIIKKRKAGKYYYQTTAKDYCAKTVMFQVNSIIT